MEELELNADWSQANCRDKDPETMFGSNANQKIEKRICQLCPVKYDCLAVALDNRIEWGVWGGLTERERRALLRRHPHVTGWRKMFEAAKKENAT